VLHGNKVVEIRCAGVNKGLTALWFLQQKTFDFILAAGDDLTDEDLFRVLPEQAYSIKVGMSQTYARFNLYNYRDVVELLKN